MASPTLVQILVKIFKALFSLLALAFASCSLFPPKLPYLYLYNCDSQAYLIEYSSGDETVINRNQSKKVYAGELKNVNKKDIRNKYPPFVEFKAGEVKLFIDNEMVTPIKFNYASQFLRSYGFLSSGNYYEIPESIMTDDGRRIFIFF